MPTEVPIRRATHADGADTFQNQVFSESPKRATPKLKNQSDGEPALARFLERLDCLNALPLAA
jgi:hypothetical protein